MKKAYSPVKWLNRDSARVRDGRLVLDLENRHDFLDFSDLQVAWTLGAKEGSASVELPPGQRGQVVIEGLPDPQLGESLVVSFTDPRAVEVNRLEFAPGQRAIEPIGMPAPEVSESGQRVEIRQGGMVVQIDRRSGMAAVSCAGKPVISSGPHLMIVPLNNEGNTQMQGETKHFEAFTPVCAGWKCERVEVVKNAAKVSVEVAGSYDEAEGVFRWSFSAGSRPLLSYEFSARKEVNPRQWGAVFGLPQGFDRISWQRIGHWTGSRRGPTGRGWPFNQPETTTCGPGSNRQRARPAS